MISVIIPCYNNSQTISRAILSVLSQTYSQFEIIVIDDSSTDIQITELIIEKIDDKRIKLIKHFQKRNGAVCRNSGILSAKGNYIAFLDADDEWKPNHLKNLISLIQVEKADIVYSSCTVYGLDSLIYTLPENSISLSKNLSEYLFCDNGFIQTSCILITNKIAKEILFNEKLIRHQDYDFLLRIENSNAFFSWSAEPTVIVHWENNDINKKGGTWKYSENWFKEYKKYLSPKARTGFMLKFVVMRLLQSRDLKTGIAKFFRYCHLLHISPKKYYFLISTLLFGKIILPKK
jgi:glycosyltransferase involved in cell wall biosynthesis